VRWFESYLRTILQKDIQDLSKIDGLVEIPKILQMIALRVGSTLNMSSLSGQTGVKYSTFKRYLALLHQIFLLVSIPAWTANAEGRLVKSPKIYLNDTGLLSYLMGNLDDEDLYMQRSTAGAVLENYVVMELVKQVSWYPKRLKLFHFSIHQGADLVIEQGPKRIYGIEVKTAASVSTSDFNGLRKLKELTKEKFQKGIVFYTGDKAVSFGDKLQAVPLCALWS
jgi:predicted AAA+ superfamily ATPase